MDNRMKPMFELAKEKFNSQEKEHFDNICDDLLGKIGNLSYTDYYLIHDIAILDIELTESLAHLENYYKTIKTLTNLSIDSPSDYADTLPIMAETSHRIEGVSKEVSVLLEKKQLLFNMLLRESR